MKPIVVPPKERINLFEEEFESLLEVSLPYMNEFQRNMVRKLAGEYTTRDKAEDAHNSACDYIHSAISNAISKEVKSKFFNRHDELRFMLGLISRIKEFELKK